MKKIDFGSNEEFISNYEKFKSSRKMAEFYNCNKSTILKHAKKIGYEVSNNKEKKITLIPIEQVIEDYELLHSCSKVGEKYGCSGTAVRNYLNSNGYELKNYQAKLADVKEEDFIKDYEILKSAKKMGEKYGCSDTAILKFAEKIGYDVNSNKNYKLSDEDKEYILQCYNERTSTDLASSFNVSRGMITKLWYDNNLIGKVNTNITTTEKDITGQDFGFWHVLYKTDKRGTGGIIYWHCRCKCGVERDVLGSSLRQGLSLSCGNHSNVSKGNALISKILQENNINFETEKKFADCKDKGVLPFDFYVEDSYLIEYDGIQHYQETMYDYEYTHAHDLIKNNWCKEKGIPLIRIPYTHFDNLCLEDLMLDTSKFII